MLFGLSGPELATLGGIIVGLPGGFIGGYVKLLAHFGKAERSFRASLMEQEARCRAENQEMRSEVTLLHARIVVVEREKTLAEAQVLVAHRLGQIGKHLGIEEVDHAEG